MAASEHLVFWEYETRRLIVASDASPVLAHRPRLHNSYEHSSLHTSCNTVILDHAVTFITFIPSKYSPWKQIMKIQKNTKTERSTEKHKEQQYIHKKYILTQINTTGKNCNSEPLPRHQYMSNKIFNTILPRKVISSTNVTRITPLIASVILEMGCSKQSINQSINQSITPVTNAS